MLNIVYAIIGAVFMVGMALFAFLKGGRSERIGAGAYLFAWFATIVMQEGSGFRGVPLGLFLIAFRCSAFSRRSPGGTASLGRFGLAAYNSLS